MDEDQESSTPPWRSERETAGYGHQDSAQPQGHNSINGPSGMTVPVGGPSAGGAFTEAKVVVSPVMPSSWQPEVNEQVGGEEEVSDPLDEETPLDFDYDEAVPGFEAAASDCLNRALTIARSLNHVVLSSDHLMLALTMDPNARRQLERFGDVAQLREVATLRLGKMHIRYSSGASFPSQTSDLRDIRNAAREAAAEREQLVAISDLINAFAKANGRFTYGSAEGSQALALMGKIEQTLVPRVAEAIARMETLARDAVQGQQNAQTLLRDLSARYLEEAERRQQAFMDELSRQVREIADNHIAAALREFGERLTAKPSEPEPEPAAEPQDPDEPVPFSRPQEPAPDQTTRSRSYWSWLVL